jgi:formylglycine-generating enzyme required for sulfatase activity/endonuclease/exonuclease/phosphatase family metal-dependent hydrolase/glycerophosphoryl diester phosphodiesterase
MKNVRILALTAWFLGACNMNSTNPGKASDHGADSGDIACEDAKDALDPGKLMDVSADASPKTTNYRVMTFNVMCPVCDPWYDPWEQRLKYLGDVLMRHDPDLIGLQELILAEDVDSILSVAPGYAAVFYRGDDQFIAYPDATILYRVARFDLMASGSFWLSPTPEVPWSKGFADGQVVPRLVTWARLHDRDAGIDMVFATTHFDSTDPHQRHSAPLVLERLSAMAAETPIIFVGDLNSEPFHPAYGILTGRAGGFGFHLEDAFGLAPTWHVDANTDPAPPYDPADRIDHVMVAGGAWSCTDWRADLFKYGASAKFPSDHRAVIADLTLVIPAGGWSKPIDNPSDAFEDATDEATSDIMVSDVPAGDATTDGSKDTSEDACEDASCNSGPCPPGFVLVPAGYFTMGSPEDEPGRGSDEGLMRVVTITNAFCLQATEVTQGQWKALMGNNPSSYASCGMSCPVEQVNWFDALAFCNALSAKDGLPPCYVLAGCSGTAGDRYTCSEVTFAGIECTGYRLPTEAEWEYAARAGTTAGTYIGTIDDAHLACEEPNPTLDGIAWTCATVWQSPKPVASKQPNGWGIYDMLGNVWEWVWDRYGVLEGGGVSDPTGSEVGPWRVFRGGAWDAEARYARAACRYHNEPGAALNDLGFRVARTVYHGPWQVSLANCWADPSCQRALVMSHGGDWDAYLPYDSHGAFVRAYEKGSDAIKTDVLVTKDNIPVVAHSSPIMPWESPECAGQKIEEMTADEVTACHLAMSETETYQRLDDVIEWAKDKVILMLTVKSNEAFQRAIQAILEHNAQDRIFVEVYLDTFLSVIPSVPDHDKVRYNVQIDSFDDITTLVDTIKDPTVILCETDSATLPDADIAKMSDAIANRLHPAGIGAFIDARRYVSVEAQAGLFQEGFDVVMTYSLDNAITARIQVNKTRDITPP